MPVSTVDSIVTASVKQVLALTTGGISLFNGLIWSSAAAGTQLQFFENYPGLGGFNYFAYSNGTLSVQLVNIPQALSFNFPVVQMTASSAVLSGFSGTVQFGLYSLTGSTLTLLNSASNTIGFGLNATGLSWLSLVTSATSNISAGVYYFGLNILSSLLAHSSMSLLGNSNINPVNAQPLLIRGRMTASTNAIPISIATTDLDITGVDAVQQAYIIITA